MKARLIAVVMTLVVAGGACGGSEDSGNAAPADDGDGRTVVLKNIAFSPDSLSIAVGETVVWKFDDGGVPHNVIAEDGSFQSETTNSGSFTFTFDKPGKFRYVCTLHPIMKGVVQVR